MDTHISITEEELAEYMELKRIEKTGKKRITELKEKIKSTIGTADSIIIHGYKLLKKSIKRTLFNTEQFKKDKPELYKEYSKVGIAITIEVH